MYLQIAQTSIADLYALPDSPENREQVKKVLRQLRYGTDGYFFVYDYQVVNLVLGPKPEIEGKNLFNAKDAGGKFLSRTSSSPHAMAMVILSICGISLL